MSANSTHNTDSSTSPSSSSSSSDRSGEPVASRSSSSNDSIHRVSRSNSSAIPELQPDIKPYPLDDPDLSPTHPTTTSSSTTPSPTAATLTPSSHFVDPLLTDLYQLTMAYAYFSQGKHNDTAVFDLFFREPPFGGEFCVFAGLEEVLRFVASWRVTSDQIEALRARYPEWVSEFWEWLGGVTLKELRIYAVEEVRWWWEECR